MVELGEKVIPTGRYHNPTIKEGAFVMSQLLQDEQTDSPAAGRGEDLYQLSLQGTNAVLYNVYGVEVVKMNCGDLAEHGIYGEERFTVIRQSLDPKR